jgi:cytochrome c556
MTIIRQPRGSSRRWMSAVIGVSVGAIALGGSFTASGQQGGATPPADIIFARKTVMSVIANNMYEIDQMMQTGKYDLTRGRTNADSISAMMMAFPHLFPESTNTWVANAPRNPGVDTFADPTIWKSFEFFYKEVQASVKYAYNASRAVNEAEFKKNATELRLACDTCHASYQKNN